MCGGIEDRGWAANTMSEVENCLRGMEEWRTEQYLMNKRQSTIAQAHLYNEQRNRMAALQASLGSPSPYNYSHTATEQNIITTTNNTSPYQWQGYGGYITITKEAIENGMWDADTETVKIPSVDRKETPTNNEVLKKLRGRMKLWLDSALMHARSCQVSQ